MCALLPLGLVLEEDDGQVLGRDRGAAERPGHAGVAGLQKQTIQITC